MANNKKPSNSEQIKQAIAISDKTESLVYGTSGEFERTDDKVIDEIKKSIYNIQRKYNRKTGKNMIDYFKSTHFANTVLGKMQENKEKNINGKNEPFDTNKFKQIMTKEGISKSGDLLAQDLSRIQTYKNYEQIWKNIPQAAQALDIIKHNIMSPDDFTKTMFRYDYLDDDPKVKEKVIKKLEEIIDKYDVEELADDVINKALIYGDCYVAVLSLEKELSSMLKDFERDDILNESVDNIMKILSESSFFQDYKLYKENVELNETEKIILKEYLYGTDKIEEIDDEKLVEDIVDIINSNVEIVNKKSLLIERVGLELENIKGKNLIEDKIYNDIDDFMTGKKKINKNKKEDKEPIGINGSSIRVLDPRKVIELKVDNVVYGWYYIESDDVLEGTASPVEKPVTGHQLSGLQYIGTDVTGNNSRFDGGISNMGELPSAKIEIIKNVFINGIAKKINKEYVKYNKEFKDFIYELVKQRYFLEKKVKLIYFNPDEIIHFKVPSIYRKVLFFAKLFIATMANEILIKMGRGHDKRIFYIEMPPDANVEQAVIQVVQDIKTREFSMPDINDIGTVLNLNSGRFHDWYIPVINGEEAIRIDVLQGMDSDLNNDFLQFLLSSILSGIGVPATLIDALNNDIDYARTLSAQNANFVRMIINYQKKLTMPFTRLLRTLYENETRFTSSGDLNESDVDIDKIKASFPSPASLEMTTMAEHIQMAQQHAEFLSNVYVPLSEDDPVQSVQRRLLQSKFLRELLPNIDWSIYDSIYKKSETELTEIAEKLKKDQSDEQSNEYGYGGYNNY